MIHHIERINQENQQIISQKFKTYVNGRPAHTNFGNSSGYNEYSLFILKILIFSETVSDRAKQTKILGLDHMHSQWSFLGNGNR